MNVIMYHQSHLPFICDLLALYYFISKGKNFSPGQGSLLTMGPTKSGVGSRRYALCAKEQWTKFYGNSTEYQDR